MEKAKTLLQNHLSNHPENLTYLETALEKGEFFQAFRKVQDQWDVLADRKDIPVEAVQEWIEEWKAKNPPRTK